MYPLSSQRQYWTFKNEQDIAELRRKHNAEFIERHGSGLNVKLKTKLLYVFRLEV